MTKLDILKTQFGYDSFRCGQEEVIDSILAGRDVLAVMPTGAGKSLCYQIPALILPGMTIVISPLISLMKDQVNALRNNGCSAAFLNSSLSGAEYKQVMDDLENGQIKLLYIAPERLQNTQITSLIETDNVSLVVVDEAHCVSQWGHDFRMSYLQIADFVGRFKKRPVTAAFTATATVKVREDILNLLALKNHFFINTGFDRPNLYLSVLKPKEKMAALLECLKKYRGSGGNLSSGIVYCATRKAVKEVCAMLIKKGFLAARYHAGLEDSERCKNQDDFLYDRVTVMVATNAFGMGIDKSNISFVIHYNMPKNIESYYQEAGRAGRDGEPADCILLYNGQDVVINKFLISNGNDDEASNAELELHNLELLKQMTFYATGNDCLRHRLLSYFGEDSSSYCGNCSNCLTEFEECDVTLESRKIVSCVYRLKQRNRSFGKIMIIDILRGSKNEKIRRFNLDTLSTWGIMKDTSAQRIRTILDALIDEGILLLEDSEYPIVTIGKYSGELLREERKFIVKLPKEYVKADVELKQSEYTSGKDLKAQVLSTDIDDALFEKLKRLRNELAVKEAVPAYIVFSNATLRDICIKKPVSLVQFAAVNGVGKAKLEKYGEIFTRAVSEFNNENR